MVMGISLHMVPLLVHLAICSSGQALPYMTSDVEEVSVFSTVGGARRLALWGPLHLGDKHYGHSLIKTDEHTSVAQAFVSEDGVSNLRARVLGGASAINGGFYSRASEDFVKKDGWNKSAVRDAYEWVEARIVPKADITPWSYVVAFSFLEAGIFPYNGFTVEHIPGTKIGGSLFDEQGNRRFAADLLRAGNASRITVLLNATVDNVIFDTNCSREEKTARGVRFIKSDNSSDQAYEAYLNHPDDNSSPQGDVILTAGALGSPQILLLSGIGPREHLNSFGIPPVLDLGVGLGMQDNPALALLVDSTPQNRTPEPPKVAGITDDFQIILEAGILPVSLNTTILPIAAKLAFTESIGSLKLNTTNPRANPSVTFNYLSTEKDQAQCVALGHLLEQVIASESIAQFLGSNKHQNKVVSTGEELRNQCKKNVRTFYHYHGGCIKGSVVDHNYRVFGVKGLRVIDGSTFVESPGTNPMATVLMLGRYQGLKILQEKHDM